MLLAFCLNSSLLTIACRKFRDSLKSFLISSKLRPSNVQVIIGNGIPDAAHFKKTLSPMLTNLESNTSIKYGLTSVKVKISNLI